MTIYYRLLINFLIEYSDYVFTQELVIVLLFFLVIDTVNHDIVLGFVMPFEYLIIVFAFWIKTINIISEKLFSKDCIICKGVSLAIQQSWHLSSNTKAQALLLPKYKIRLWIFLVIGGFVFSKLCCMHPIAVNAV